MTDEKPTPLLPPWLVVVLVALLAVVIGVGLLRRELDVTGIALALISMITGLTGGQLLRAHSGRRDSGEGGEG